ncbi:MAG: ATP-binding cassette domain-containing protein [Woeseia sp.]|nr:ATP-binding cassette domain-containing protein [Woeseia sp.]MBT8095996.1 ATP-binding cassette domain-containing protein [Woeseia sp.]NNE59498.1 ATP-binding cassette domain-containing protein [Woeseia sp.]NNL54343.1 ATP-binding cassette domain-containing protein [Woeseia sp.]
MNASDHEKPLIDIHRATIWRGSTCVFRDFSLSIGQHEQVAILGPNGAGKTTLLKLVNREIYPVAADGSWVRILGRENWNVWDLRSHIGLVSQDLQNRYRDKTRGLQVVVSGYLSSVGVHGLLARRVSKDQIKKARAALTDLGVGELADTPLANMSTGQQRRCLLARALVHDPQTLILDEPTSGLDLAASFDYLARVRDLVSAGISIVLVTHAVHEIPPAIRRVILLRDGRIVADGSRETVLTRDNLQAAFNVEMRVRELDGYYFAYPDERGSLQET